MARVILSVKVITHKGVGVVLVSLFVMCICSCATPPNATIALKTLSESMALEDIGKIQNAIEAGADVNVRNKYGVTSLYAASLEGHAEIVKLLVAANADVNAADTDGVTPLWIASQVGHTKTVKLLITAKANVNVTRKTDGVTPLLKASQNGHFEIVNLLVAANADVNVADIDGVTPLLIASQKGHVEIVKLLLIAGAQEKNMTAKKAAVVNGVAIYQSEIDREFAEVEKQASVQGQKIPDDRIAQIKNSIIDKLVNEELLVQESESHGIKVESSEVETAFAKIQKRFNGPSALEKALAKSDITIDDLKIKIKRGIAVKKLIDQEIDQEVINAIVVSDADTRAFYDEHPEYFKQDEQVKASHILIKCAPDADAATKETAMKKIKDIQQKLKDGESFAELAKQFSDDPSRTQGGDLGFFEREKMVKPFADAAFVLPVGNTSDIVETDFGFHLIQVTDKKTTSDAYEIVKERINSYLKQEEIISHSKEQEEIISHSKGQEKMKAVVGEYIESLRKKATIEK